MDLGSANGTWVNDTPVDAPRSLEPGDVIRVGTDVLEVLPTQALNDDRPRPTTNARKRTETSPDDTRNMTFDDAPRTETAESQLELIEALVASAAEARRPLAMAPMLQRAIEGLIGLNLHHARLMPSAEAVRLAAMIEIVASWCPEELGEWRARALSTMRTSSAPLPIDLRKQ